MDNKNNCFARTVMCLTLIAVLVGCVALCSVGTTASAATSNPSPDAEPLGLVTRMSLQIGSDGSNVWVRAHNDFTLGPSTVAVYVYLYSSTSYQEDINNMALMSRNYIGDLNINKSIETSYPIYGEERYWRGRMMYRLDNKDWVSKETITYLVGADGQLIM